MIRMKMTWTALRASLTLMLICGLLYPLATTGVAQVLFPRQANGSLIESDGRLVGSALIAQRADSPKLFHPRLSKAGYDPTASAGSNLAVASGEYVQGLTDAIAAWRKDNPASPGVPADAVTFSGSGLDPDLSPAAAQAQVPRISRETGIREQRLYEMIAAHTKGRQLGVFGEPRVSVLELNLELLKQVKL